MHWLRLAVDAWELGLVFWFWWKWHRTAEALSLHKQMNTILANYLVTHIEQVGVQNIEQGTPLSMVAYVLQRTGFKIGY